MSNLRMDDARFLDDLEARVRKIETIMAQSRRDTGCCTGAGRVAMDALYDTFAGVLNEAVVAIQGVRDHPPEDIAFVRMAGMNMAAKLAAVEAVASAGRNVAMALLADMEKGKETG